MEGNAVSKMKLGVKIQACSECDQMNMAIDAFNTFKWPSFFMDFHEETKEILIDESQIMRIIQMANPAQEVRRIRLVSREELREIREQK